MGLTSIEVKFARVQIWIFFSSQGCLHSFLHDKTNPSKHGHAHTHRGPGKVGVSNLTQDFGEKPKSCSNNLTPFIPYKVTVFILHGLDFK